MPLPNKHFTHTDWQFTNISYLTKIKVRQAAEISRRKCGMSLMRNQTLEYRRGKLQLNVVSYLFITPGHQFQWFLNLLPTDDLVSLVTKPETNKAFWRSKFVISMLVNNKEAAFLVGRTSTVTWHYKIFKDHQISCIANI